MRPDGLGVGAGFIVVLLALNGVARFPIKSLPVCSEGVLPQPQKLAEAFDF
jgi:hypothetical protein